MKKNDKENFDLTHIFTPPPMPIEVKKIHIMLNQVEKWIALGEVELSEKHWDLISDECRKYGTGKKLTSPPEHPSGRRITDNK